MFAIRTPVQIENNFNLGKLRFSVKAGQPALDFFTAVGRPDLFKPSLGAVESLDLAGLGAPATDFAADSFFNVYAVIETPFGPLFNKEPLLVVSRG